MDQAGWHMTGKLDVPHNISIFALPAKCPSFGRRHGAIEHHTMPGEGRHPPHQFRAFPSENILNMTMYFVGHELIA
jgi:hypothetical protein